MTEPAVERPDPSPAERAADAALAVPGVARLHGGRLGEVATRLPGRAVPGVRLGERVEVHVVLRLGVDLRSTADDVRVAVRSALDGGDPVPPIDVVIADLDVPGEDDGPGAPIDGSTPDEPTVEPTVEPTPEEPGPGGVVDRGDAAGSGHG